MYGLMGGRLRRWLAGNGLHLRGEIPTELSAPAPRLENAALPANTDDIEPSAAAPRNTTMVAMNASQDVLNEVEAKSSGAGQAPAATQ